MPARCDVSVVVSTFNRAGTLERLLATLLAQRAEGLRYEIIVVDNNSRDRTAEVLETWSSRYPTMIRHAREPRPGVSYGRNLGASLATGPILAFTDDDVRPATTWVRAVHHVFEANPEIHFAGGKVLPDWTTPPPVWLTKRHWGPLGLVDYGDETFVISRNCRLCLVGANLAVRRTTFENAGGFDPAFHRSQDHELLLRLWRSDRTGLYVPDLVVTAAVPSERLTKAYHRMWHDRNARYYALMSPEDLFWFETGDPALITVRGVPLFTFRQLVQECAALPFAWAAGRGSDALYHEVRVRHLWRYIASRRRLHTSSVGLVRELTLALATIARRKRRMHP